MKKSLEKILKVAERLEPNWFEVPVLLAAYGIGYTIGYLISEEALYAHLSGIFVSAPAYTAVRILERSHFVAEKFKPHKIHNVVKKIFKK